MNESLLLFFRQSNDIGAVTPMNGNASALCYKPYDVISRNRVAAFRKFNHQVVRTFHNDARAVFGTSLKLCLSRFGSSQFINDCFIGFDFGMIFFRVVSKKQICEFADQGSSVGKLRVCFLGICKVHCLYCLVDKGGFCKPRRIVTFLAYIFIKKVFSFFNIF